MAKRGVLGSGPAFELFPFLGILACTLGCLLLVVVSMVALSVGPGAAENWYVEGKGKKSPRIVEWDGMMVTIHPSKTKVSASAAMASNGRNSSPFGKLLAEVKADGKRQYIFILVRPSGFSNFGEFRKMIFNDWGIDIGYEPVDQARPISVGGEQK